jgi:hypothetical protein
MTYSAHDPALSFRKQPNLGLLFRTLAKETGPITIVFGAGVSCDAGLPNWSGLVENLCRQTADPELAERLMQDHIDLLLKVEYALQSQSMNEPIMESIRRALYADIKKGPKPGRLADAIARFTSSISHRVSLITTNFDIVMEEALGRYFPPSNVSPAGLRSRSTWLEARGDPERASVLHLNGLIVPSAASQEEQLVAAQEQLVLSQSTFYTLGADIRSIVEEALQTSHVLFVGISLNDPNLVTSLFATLSERKLSKWKAFNFLVDVSHAQKSPAGDLYMQQQVAYHEKELFIKTVVCKSYSQVQQVMFDLSLATRKPQAYLQSTRSTSLRYGHRFKRALMYAYRGIGLSDREVVPEQEKAEALSRRLFEALWDREGPGTIAKKIGSQIAASRLRQHGIKARKFLDSEGFALFLWLRCRVEGRNEIAPFELRLIGSSAYSQRQSWSQERIIPIAVSNYTAGTVAFEGQSRLEDLGDERSFATWLSVFGVPIIWTNPDEPHDQLLLGVITLNSNRRTLPLDEMRRATADGTDVEERMRPSVLSFFSEEEDQRLKSTLLKVGLEMINSDSR